MRKKLRNVRIYGSAFLEFPKIEQHKTLFEFRRAKIILTIGGRKIFFFFLQLGWRRGKFDAASKILTSRHVHERIDLRPKPENFPGNLEGSMRPQDFGANLRANRLSKTRNYRGFGYNGSVLWFLGSERKYLTNRGWLTEYVGEIFDILLLCPWFGFGRLIGFGEIKIDIFVEQFLAYFFITSIIELLRREIFLIKSDFQRLEEVWN